jgi:DNA-binding transcriptional regulator YdaS (Cro superfamily)
MDLRTYLETKKMGSKEFAEIVLMRTGIDVSESAISTYKLGKRMPSLVAALAIEKATRGQVSLEDMLILRPKERIEGEEPDAS